MADKQQLVVGPCEVRFPHLDQTEQFQGVDSGKFSCTFMFDPDSPSVADMKKAIAQANGGKGSNPLQEILDTAEYDPGKFRIKGKSKFKVKVVDKDNRVVDDPQGRVQGATVQAALAFVPYSMGTGGVTCYLQAIRILDEGSGGSVDFGDLPSGYGSGNSLDDPPF